MHVMRDTAHESRQQPSEKVRTAASGNVLNNKGRKRFRIVNAPPSMMHGAAIVSLHMSPESLIAPPQQAVAPPGRDEQPSPAQVPQLREQLRDRGDSVGRGSGGWERETANAVTKSRRSLGTSPPAVALVRIEHVHVNRQRRARYKDGGWGLVRGDGKQAAHQRHPTRLTRQLRCRRCLRGRSSRSPTS